MNSTFLAQRFLSSYSKCSASTLANSIRFVVADAKWYTQTATGDVPPDRRKFCAGATWAKDQSSYSIYLYGGYGFGENTTGFDDVYILTLPAFEWIKWYPDAPGEKNPHGLLTCNVIDNAQMIVMGGNATTNVNCDVPDYGGQHNLNLGQNNPTNAKWYPYLTNLTSYSVPQDIISVAGGSSGGGASRSSPSNGFDDAALSVYFGGTAQFATRTPTRYIPTQTATPPSKRSHNNIGPIVGGVVGGVAVLIIIVLAACCCLRRRKRPQSDQRASPPPPSSNITEMTGESYRDKGPGSVAAATSPHSHPSSPYSTSPPLQPAHFVQYAHPSPGVQQYYPMVTQQQHPGYGYQQHQYPHMSMSGSPPGMYPPQGYPPPTEIPNMSMTSTPPVHLPYEMPTSRDHAVGVQHIDHQPSSTPNKVSMRDSVSDPEKSHFSAYSSTRLS